MDIQLSNRLKAVADMVPQGVRLLDVGSDHAYLPIALIKMGVIEFAIAGEVVKGPYDSARTNVIAAGLSEQISVRLADGLAALQEVDKISLITICGMGGRLIADILEEGLEKLDKINQLILQPNNREDDLRLWLSQHGFKIVAEKILVEKGKFYEIMAVEHGVMSLSDKELRFGPFLSQEKSDNFKAKWQKELGKLEVALSHIPKEHWADRSAISQKIKSIKEAIDES